MTKKIIALAFILIFSFSSFVIIKGKSIQRRSSFKIDNNTELDKNYHNFIRDYKFKDGFKGD